MTATDEDNSGIDGIEVMAMTENKSFATFELVMQCIILVASIFIFYTYAFGVRKISFNHYRAAISATEARLT